MKTILSIISSLLLVSAIHAQEQPKKLSALHYIPTLYVEKGNPNALAPLAEKIKAQLPIGAEVRYMLLADSTMVDIRKWQLNENRKWEERMNQFVD